MSHRHRKRDRRKNCRSLFLVAVSYQLSAVSQNQRQEQPLHPAPTSLPDPLSHRERGRKTGFACRSRFLLAPKARRKNIAGEDFFYRLPSSVSPHSGNHEGCPYINNNRVSRAGCPRSRGTCHDPSEGAINRKRTPPPSPDLSPGPLRQSCQLSVLSRQPRSRTESKIKSNPSTRHRPLSPALSPKGKREERHTSRAGQGFFSCRRQGGKTYRARISSTVSPLTSPRIRATTRVAPTLTTTAFRGQDALAPGGPSVRARGPVRRRGRCSSRGSFSEEGFR